MGITSIDLTGPKEWPTMQQYGLTSGMANGAGLGIEKGWNRRERHETLLKSYEDVIPLVAKAGMQNLICFSGNREGQDDAEGIKICAEGLKKLMPTAEKYKVNVVMELLNSKVNHHDYQCDHTVWAANAFGVGDAGAMIGVEAQAIEALAQVRWQIPPFFNGREQSDDLPSDSALVQS
jgi:hydroxypyruvate isomerase